MNNERDESEVASADAGHSLRHIWQYFNHRIFLSLSRTHHPEDRLAT